MIEKSQKRIQTIISMTPSNSHHYYDLFCDHGKVGLNILKKYPSAYVHFIDIREHIIDKLLRENSKLNSRATFEVRDARDVIIYDCATVFLCGVGGHLIKDCLVSYLKEKKLLSTVFIISANIHTLELRQFLLENNFSCIEEKIAIDNYRCYEILSVRALAKNEDNKSPVALFNKSAWSATNTYHKLYLASKLKNLNNKRTLTSYEQSYYNNLKDFYEN